MKDIAIKIIGVLLMLSAQSALAYTAFAFLHPADGSRALFHNAENYPSQAEADARALTICNRRIASPVSPRPGRCVVDPDSQIHDQCVSITERHDVDNPSNTMLFYGFGTTRQAAEAEALSLLRINTSHPNHAQRMFRCDADGNNCSPYRYTTCDMTSAGAAPIDDCTGFEDYCRRHNIDRSASSGGAVVAAGRERESPSGRLPLSACWRIR